MLVHIYNSIISIENLLDAWKYFKNGKRSKEDVSVFEQNLMNNIFQLHRELSDGRYRHSGYHAFKINDPKPRDIHKASVRDRLLHHAIYHKIYHFFDQTFIFDSYSCRKNKGTHKALKRFQEFSLKVSKNHTQSCWVLKCDIKKFFASIDHIILKNILKKYISDFKTFSLLENIIDSFETAQSSGKGLPLGNLTSQLLVNIYMNKFDHFVKHSLKQTYYIRYADDFVFLSYSEKNLEEVVPIIQKFLWEQLKLEIHPQKLFIKTLFSGVDFLGWVHFCHHRVLRTSTKKRMLRNIKRIDTDPEKIKIIVQSYLGLLDYGDTYYLKQIVLNIYDYNN